MTAIGAELSTTYKAENMYTSLYPNMIPPPAPPPYAKELKEVTPLLVLTGVATTIGGSLPVGYNIGVVNAPAHIIGEFCNVSIAHLYGVKMDHTQLEVLWSVVVSIFLVGGVTGSLSGGWVADRFGRKGTVIVSNIISVVAAVLFLFSRAAGSVEMLLLGRLLVGLSSGLVTSTNPMYLTEIAPISIRGAMGVLCPLGVTFGVLVSQILSLYNVLGEENTWHYLLALYAVLVILCSIPIPLLPESPKYLYIVRGHEQESIRELSRLRGVPPDQLQDEVEELRRGKMADAQLRSSGETWTIRRVISAPALRLPLMLVCSLQAGQQLSGINAVFYYSMSIFESAGLGEETSQYASIGAGCVNLFMAVLATYLVSRFGRRPLALFSSWSAAVCLILLCISITYVDEVMIMPYVCIFVLLAYVFCYGCGLGPIPYFIGSELFLVGPRPAGMALGSMANWGGNFMVGITFPEVLEGTQQYSFLFYALATVLLAIFLQYYLPETKLRNISDIANMVQYGLHSHIYKLPIASAPVAGPDAETSSSQLALANESEGDPEKANQ